MDRAPRKREDFAVKLDAAETALSFDTSSDETPTATEDTVRPEVGDRAEFDG